MISSDSPTISGGPGTPISGRFLGGSRGPGRLKPSIFFSPLKRPSRSNGAFGRSPGPGALPRIAGRPGTRVRPGSQRVPGRACARVQSVSCILLGAHLSKQVNLKSLVFGRFRGQNRPGDPSRSTGLVLQCRLHRKSALETSPRPISWPFSLLPQFKSLPAIIPSF